jgi:hypothetical protein
LAGYTLNAQNSLALSATRGIEMSNRLGNQHASPS